MPSLPPHQRLPSLFIVFYVASVILAALPSPQAFERALGERESPDDRVSRHVRPRLDAIQPPMEATLLAARRLTEPGRRRALRPLLLCGLAQNWMMFSNPPRSNSAVVLRVVAIGPKGGSEVRAARISPVLDEDRYKPLSAYTIYSLDKAISNASDSWVRMKRRSDEVGRLEADFGADVLAPVTRVFGRRLAADLPPGSRVVRVELWQGSSPMPVRGEVGRDPLPPLDALPLSEPTGRFVRNGRASWTLRQVDAWQAP